MVTFVPATNAGVAVPVPPLATSKRPANVCVAFQAVAPAVLNDESAAVEWVTVMVMPRISVYREYADKFQQYCQSIAEARNPTCPPPRTDTFQCHLVDLARNQ